MSTCYAWHALIVVFLRVTLLTLAVSDLLVGYGTTSDDLGHRATSYRSEEGSIVVRQLSSSIRCAGWSSRQQPREASLSPTSPGKV